MFPSATAAASAATPAGLQSLLNPSAAAACAPSAAAKVAPDEGPAGALLSSASAMCASDLSKLSAIRHWMQPHAAGRLPLDLPAPPTCAAHSFVSRLPLDYS